MVIGHVQEGTDGMNDGRHHKPLLTPDGFLSRVGDRYLNLSTNIVFVLCSICAGTSLVGTGACTSIMRAYIFWDLGCGGLPEASKR